MKRQFFYLLGILLTIIIGTLAQCYFCCSNTKMTAYANEAKPVEKVLEKEISEEIEETQNIEDAKEDEIDLIKKDCDVLLAESFVVNFKSGESTANLSTAQQEKLNKIANCISELGIILTVIGHTDNTGSTATNLRVGQQRADAVKAVLIEKGVAENQITTTTKGETEPVASNNTEEGKEKNRRIEFKSNYN